MNDVRTRSVQAGSWLGLLGPELTLLLPGREKVRAARLWELVDDGARLEVVLDRVLEDGLSAVPELVLVAAAGGKARVLVRGTASVSVHTAAGPREVVAGERLWAEETFTDVSALVVTLPDAGATGPELPAALGLLRVGRVAWGESGDVARTDAPAAPRHAAAQAAPDEVPAPTAPVEAAPVAAAPVEAAPVAAAPVEAAPVAAAPVEAAPVEAAPAEAAPLEPAPVEAAPAPQPPPPAPELAADPAAVTGENPAVVPSVADPSVADHDGMTRIGAQPVPPQPPGIPGQPPAPSVTSRPVARLVFSHGTTTEVDRAILVGRAPEARRFAPGDQPQLVTVPSPHQEVSSTHLEIRPGSGVDHGMAVATDLGSTNGTLLVQPGLPPEELQPGIAVSLNPGAIIDLGDGVTIQVTKP